MQIAIIENGSVKSVGDYRSLFPNTSFGSNGPSPEFLAENNCLGVTVFKPHDRATEKLQPCAPYIENGQVFTVEVVALTQDEINAETLASSVKTIAQYEAALDEHLDSVAQQRRYDNRVTCALRAGYAGPYQAEGQAFAIWMDTCNALAYQIMSEVAQGNRSLPTIEDFIAEFPAIQWPEEA